MDSKKKKQLVRKNFLESLKEIGGGVAKSASEDLVRGIPKTAARQILGGPSIGEQSPDNLPLDNKEKFQWSRQEFTNFRSQEHLLFKQAEEEVKVQIEAIRAELLKLIQSADELSQEVKIAITQEIVDPGTYHLTFLERIHGFIIFLRKNIAESRNWLALANQRSKKRGHYWQQFKKSGTKFLLSAERYMATQAG